METTEDQHSHHGHQDNPNEFRSMRDRMHPPRGASIDLMRLKLFPFTLKDKAKIWLNSLRPRSIRTWTDLQAEFLKKFFPTHRTNGLKRQISNFSAKENEKFYECWERYMEAINACPHHGFDTWLLSQGDGMNQQRRSGKDEVSTECFHAKAGMYTLNEEVDMKAKFAAMTRRLEELELKKMHEVQAVAETPVQLLEKCLEIKQMSLDNSSPIAMLRMETYNSSWRNHPNFSWKPRAPQYQQPAQPSQQASSLEQAIVNLSKVVGDFVGDQKSINAQLSQRIDMQEKGRFPSQPHQNPKGIHEVETHEGESSQVRDVKALITLRSGKKVELPTPKPHVEEEEDKEEGGNQRKEERYQ
ncbi:hypothetical protein CK203_101726 [Vitis vinifera]|uniref:Retrotransposon gag domain-containing protein n=1 Tax=Vitis vinifera TaxID=29760 RepID=A0A438DQN2_VITVI|nr:hypothetical protein CK203_101726 [Vitis vinifera]